MMDEILCEKCGTAMVADDHERTTGMLCPKCGWGWVTTRFEPIEKDETDYVIHLLPGNDQSIEHIKLVSRITGQNFIRAKSLLGQNSPVLIYKTQKEGASEYSGAQHVQEVARELQAAGFNFKITPDFPYPIG